MTRGTLLSGSLLLLTLSRCGLALPIDCSKAASMNDRTICGDPFLLQMDARLDTLYDISTRLIAAEERSGLVEGQRVWVRQRESCGSDKNCIRAAYAKRASVFESILQRAESHGPF